MSDNKVLIVVILAVFVVSAVLLGIDYLPNLPSGTATQPVASTEASAIDPSVADTATFAGGCFWCMEPPFDRMAGVAATVSGYAGGNEPDPTYDAVSSGRTGHAEVVQVVYDSTQVGYEELLATYWRNVDPLDDGGQFCDRGTQYRPAIFVHNADQRRLAAASKAQVAERFDASIVVPIEPLDAFYPAEDYHQNFYEKNPVRYKTYREGCGRDARLEELWGTVASDEG